MLTIPILALVADTLLVRPVDVPAPWYSVATGVLSIVVTLLLLGIAAALLGMARVLKGAEKNLGIRLQGLSEELIPLARNLNLIATQLSEFTLAARNDLARLSGTIGVVDDAVRDAIDAGEARLAQFGTLADAIQDEAEATVAAATGAMRGVRTGAGALVSSLLGRNGKSSRPRRSRRAGHDDDRAPLGEDDVRARLAALEAALAEPDDDEEDDEDEPQIVARTRASRAPAREPLQDVDDWDDDDFDDDDDDDDDEYGDDEVDDDDDIEFDDDDEAEEAAGNDAGDGERESGSEDTMAEPPRHGGPRIRNRRDA